MKIVRRLFHFSFLILSLLSLTAYSKGTAVEFHGTVTRVNLTSGAPSSIVLGIMGFEVTVAVTADTEVESAGDQLKLSDIDVGDFVKVFGSFMNSGITATEVQILDSRDGAFRLQGIITRVSSAANGTLVTVLGADVLINSDTKLERRGPSGPFTAANLAVDLTIDARGYYDGGQFIATSANVGNREDDAIRIHFSGTITNATPTRLIVDTGGGSSAAVLIGLTTAITGKLAQGQFVEVTGTLNSNLEVVASRIKAKANEKEDDVPQPVTFFEIRVPIIPVGSVSSVRGDAKLQFESQGSQVQQQIEVHFTGGRPATSYNIKVSVSGAGSVSIGTVQTNLQGNGSLRLNNPSAVLPASKTVRDIANLQILASDGTVVAQATF